MKTKKAYSLRYSLNLDISSIVNASSYEEAVEKLKSMSDSDFRDLLAESSIRDHEISEVSQEGVEDAECYYRVKVYNIQFDADYEPKKPVEDETFEISVYNPTSDVEDDDIRSEIDEVLYDAYGDYPTNFDFEIIKTLQEIIGE